MTPLISELPNMKGNSRSGYAYHQTYKPEQKRIDIRQIIGESALCTILVSRAGNIESENALSATQRSLA